MLLVLPAMLLGTVGMAAPNSSQTAKIWGIETVYPTREDRLWGFLTQFHFCDFRGKEFFNSHAWFQQLTVRLA
jgi:hypothetical protein